MNKNHKKMLAVVDELLKLDLASNYECADDAAESVLSEMETEDEFNEHEASLINGRVTDWWYDNEGDDEEE